MWTTPPDNLSRISREPWEWRKLWTIEREGTKKASFEWEKGTFKHYKQGNPQVYTNLKSLLFYGKEYTSMNYRVWRQTDSSVPRGQVKGKQKVSHTLWKSTWMYLTTNKTTDKNNSNNVSNIIFLFKITNMFGSLVCRVGLPMTRLRRSRYGNRWGLPPAAALSALVETCSFHPFQINLRLIQWLLIPFLPRTGIFENSKHSQTWGSGLTREKAFSIKIKTNSPIIVSFLDSILAMWLG